MQWGDLLTDLYADTKDPAQTKIPYDLAYLYLKMAMRDYSLWNPRLLRVTLAVDTGGVASLPDDFISVYEVRETGSGAIVNPLRGIVVSPPTLTPALTNIRWWVEGSDLRFTSFADEPESVDLLYRGLHSLPATASSTTYELSFPDKDEEAILLYIRGKAMGSVRSKTSLIDRYKRRIDAGNTRTDNPIRPEENDLMADYMAYMASRYAVGGVKLSRRR